MAGFFKRMFNKIRGKDDKVEDTAPSPGPETVSPPAGAEEKTVSAKTKARPKAEKKAVKKEKKASETVTKPVEKAAKPAKKPLKKTAKPAGKPAKKRQKAVETTPEPASKPATTRAQSAPPPVATAPEADAAAVETEPTGAATAPTVSEAEATPPTTAEETAPERARAGWFKRLKSGLSKSTNALSQGITGIFTKRKLDAETLQELEDVLIQADLGVDMAERVVKAVAAGRYDKEVTPEEVRRILAEEVARVLKPVEQPFTFDDSQQPFVILVIGVNGSGKTTTIGKLGAIAMAEGYSVSIAACDTFRAAAIEQLEVWAKRIGARFMSRPSGADAAGLAYDALNQARADNSDILIIDTAGRLQNKADLMAELEKIVRVVKKIDANAPHAVLLVLDATTGQNALAQADVFTRVAGVTGIIMTKLDGTARGGILAAIAERFKLPVHAIGVGEGIEDLQPFDAEAFAAAIAGIDETGQGDRTGG